MNAQANMDGWVGHPLDPIGCLFDTLADASIIPDEQRPRTPSYLGEYIVAFKKNSFIYVFNFLIFQIMYFFNSPNIFLKKSFY